MNSKVGIVGLPNVGKSSLFNVITKQQVPAENFPFCTINPSVGTVTVPDDRLDTLANISKSKEVIPAVVEFIDIAGLVRGASKGEGLGNTFLSHIRSVDVIAHVVRAFDDASVTHVEGGIDVMRDIEVIETEIMLADLQVVEHRLEKVIKEVKKQNAAAKEEHALLLKLQTLLSSGEAVDMSNEKALSEYARSIGLISSKPVFYICNINSMEGGINTLLEYVRKRGSEIIFVSIKNECDIAELDEEEASEIRNELCSNTDSYREVIKASYRTLGLMSFFTTGEKETRAWTIPVGSTAPRAARAIHSDFEKNFIRAEVVSYTDLLVSGSMANARSEGRVRVEGKDYIVQDGDIMVIRAG